MAQDYISQISAIPYLPKKSAGESGLAEMSDIVNRGWAQQQTPEQKRSFISNLIGGLPEDRFDALSSTLKSYASLVPGQQQVQAGDALSRFPGRMPVSLPDLSYDWLMRRNPNLEAGAPGFAGMVIRDFGGTQGVPTKEEVTRIHNELIQQQRAATRRGFMGTVAPVLGGGLALIGGAALAPALLGGAGVTGVSAGAAVPSGGTLAGLKSSLLSSSALKGALFGAGSSALQGGDLSDILKGAGFGLVGGAAGSYVGGASGLSGLSRLALEGATSGGVRSLLSGNTLGDVATSALTGGATSVALGALENAFTGQGVAPSSESLASAPVRTGAISSTPASEALLGAPVGAGSAGYSVSRIAAPSSGGSFFSQLTKGLGDMDGLELLAGAGLIGGTIYSTNKASSAAEKAARQQAESAQAGIASSERIAQQQIQAAREAEQRAAQRLQPFVDVGTQTTQGLTQLVNDPNAQAEYISNNPFYQQLAQDAQNRLLANQAARGKIGSGETAKSLQESLVSLGANLLNQSVQQRQNLATLGANAAAGQATNIQNTASNVIGAQGAAGQNIANLLLQQGNAQAAGTVGAANAGTQGFNNLINTALAAYGIKQGNLLNI